MPKATPVRRDLPQKAEHAARMMHVARGLAGIAPSERQKRVFWRYVYLHADSLNRCLRDWQRGLRRTQSEDAAAATERSYRKFRQEFAKQKTIRDKLAARREAMDTARGEDLRRTAALWHTMTGSGADNICRLAADTCSVFGSTSELSAPSDSDRLAEAQQALLPMQLDPDVVYTDVTSYVAGEPNLYAITPSGPLGRVVMQIADVHESALRLDHRAEFTNSDADRYLPEGLPIAELREPTGTLPLAFAQGRQDPCWHHRGAGRLPPARARA
jgi:hypothetical protein